MGRIIGGRVLVPSVRSDGWFSPQATVFWDGETITEVSDGSLLAGFDERDGWEIDATDALVLPGIVNLHDRAYENRWSGLRGTCPEAGLRNHAAELAASGITTSFLSVGDSDTPMSRAVGSVREVADRLYDGDRRAIDLRLSVRYGGYSTEHIRELVELVQLRTVSMLSYLHPDLHPTSSRPRAFDQTVREIGRLQARRLTSLAGATRCVTASLGSSSPEHLADDLELGIRIAVLPATIELARRYVDAGVRILLETRTRSCSSSGGTSSGGVSAEDAWREGLRPLLCSGEDHRSMLAAPFELARQIGDVPRAWATVARGPAIAAGLVDRGQLSPGHRADILVIDPPRHGRPPEVRAVVAGGRVVLCREENISRASAYEQDDGLEWRAGPSIVG